MIPLLLSFKRVTEKENYAVFEAEGFWPGYGTILGNAIRKVLLSSISGAAVYKVKLKGVPHEFSTIPGVLEDTLHIILNLKNLRFKAFSDEPQKVTLKAKGEKKVTGKDLEVPSQLELVNPDLEIATLTDKNSKLELEMMVKKGVGYETEEMVKEGERLEIGEVALDAIYSPVKFANYKVENMRVGKRTDFDKLQIELETDGTIKPTEALSEALNILISQLNFLISNLEETKAKELKTSDKSQEKKKKKNEKEKSK